MERGTTEEMEVEGKGGIYGRAVRAEKHVVDTAPDIFFYACSFGFFFSFLFLLDLGGSPSRGYLNGFFVSHGLVLFF